MKLLLIRHAEAEEAAASDASRELTAYGRTSMLEIATQVARVCPNLQLILSSPFVRTVQTSGILHSRYPSAEVRMLDELISEVPAEITLKEIKRASAGNDMVACVGHEPNISHLASLCLAGSTRSFVHMSKAAVALIEFPGTLMKATGELRFLISPEVVEKN